MKAQVKNNEKALEQGSGVKGNKLTKHSEEINMEINSELSMHAEEEEGSNKKGKCHQCYHWLMRRGVDRNRKYESL